MRFHRFCLAVLLTVYCLSLFAYGQGPSPKPSLITQSMNESQLVVLKGNIHPSAQARFDRGAAPPELPMDRMLLVLKRSAEQEAALRSLLDQQQDKSSPNYHKWLTPELFGQQFGPSDEDIHTIMSWLQSQGFQVAQVSKGRSVIEFSGTAALVKQAFHTPIHKFTVNGEDHWANASDPQIPAALAPAVAGVFTLHNFRKNTASKFASERITASYEAGKAPDFTSSTGLHALTPGDYAVIYNINPLFPAINGAGTTIAVVGRSNINIQDIRDFRSVFGLSVNDPQIVLNGPDPGNLLGGEEGEAVLDVSWAGATAPGATVKFVVSGSTENTDGVDLSELYIIDNNLGNVMTESFSICELALTTSQAAGIASLAEQAAAQGITYMLPTGDSGAAGCDDPNSETVAHFPNSINALASTPFTIGVGGTMFNEGGNNSLYWNATNAVGTRASAKSYIPENVWNESGSNGGSGLWAGGGGASTFFAKPSWQTGVTGIPTANERYLPDVSLSAAGHDPYLMCLQASCQPVGGTISFAAVSGTSASSPSFAGIMALVNQKTGSRQGQANYVLYKLAATETLSQCNGSTSTLPASNCIFNDTTVGNNAVPGETGYGTSSAQYQSGVGYDLATGLGSMNVTNLVNQWNAVAFSATTTTLTLGPPTPVNIVHGASVPVNITVTSGTGTPTGDVSLVATTSAGSKSVDGFTLASGAFTGTTNLLPGNGSNGAYNVVAHYTGDGTHAPSDSTPVSVTVTPETSTTVIHLVTADALGNPIYTATTTPYFASYILRVDVGSAASSGCAVGPDCPSGNVVLTADGNPLDAGTFVLNSAGFTEDQAILLPVGTHAIHAAYAGDGSFNASAANLSITITPDFLMPASLSPVLIANPGLSGQTTLAITAPTGSTGTISFTAASCSGLPAESACSFSPATVTGSGSTTITVTTTASHKIAQVVLPRQYYLARWMKTTGGGMIFAGVFFIGMTKKRRLWSGLLGLIVIAFLATGIGCGGGNSGGSGSTDPGTPLGSYTVTVTATSGSVTHTTTFQLAVQ